MHFLQGGPLVAADAQKAIHCAFRARKEQLRDRLEKRKIRRKKAGTLQGLSSGRTDIYSKHFTTTQYANVCVRVRVCVHACTLGMYLKIFFIAKLINQLSSQRFCYPYPPYCLW